MKQDILTEQERRVLVAAARLDYHGDYISSAVRALGTEGKARSPGTAREHLRSVANKLGTKGGIFSSTLIALGTEALTLEELAGGAIDTNSANFTADDADALLAMYMATFEEGMFNRRHSSWPAIESKIRRTGPASNKAQLATLTFAVAKAYLPSNFAELPLRKNELSIRQLEVIREAARLTYSGSFVDQIVSQLWIAEATAKAHLRTVYKVMHVSDLASAVTQALEENIFSIEELADGRLNEMLILLTKLTERQKKMIEEFHACAKDGGVTYEMVARRMMEGFAEPITGSAVKSAVFKLYEQVPASNQAQLAVVAYAYANPKSITF